MMIDFALEAEREQGLSAARGHLPGVPAALPAHHDDHDGGAPRRAAAGARHAAPARSCGGRSASPSWAASLISQLLTLYTTPVIYLYMARLGRACGRAARRPHEAGPADRRLERRRCEHLRALHPAAGRHLAARRGAPARGRGGLHAAAGGAAAAGGLPHHQRQRRPARRQPRDHGLGGGHAARAALRPHRRPHRDHLDELARRDRASPCSSTSTATSTPPRATCRPPSTPPRGDLPANLPDAAQLTAR